MLSEYNPGTIFLITGKDSYSGCGAEGVLQEIFLPYKVHRFSDFSRNPTDCDLERGIKAFRIARPDLVIAVGGGSAIDVAKAMNGLAQTSIDIRYCLTEGAGAIGFGRKPLIAIPTTAGTGSEATRFATLYVDGQKHSLSDISLIPDVAILDPNFLMSLSSHQSALSGMDALCQGIEACWSIHSTDESSGFARRAISTSYGQIEKMVMTSSPTARAQMIIAAHLAGRAIDIAQTTAPHALSYPLTSRFKIPHGQAVSLTLPSFLVFNSEVVENDSVDPRGANYTRKVIGKICSLLDCETAREAAEKIRQLMSNIGLAISFAELRVDKRAAIEVMIAEVSMQRLSNNPRTIPKEALSKLLYDIP